MRRDQPEVRQHEMTRSKKSAFRGTPFLIAASLFLAPLSVSHAEERISNPVAVFTGLDKITARIVTFDVYIDETVQFGSLQVTPRACYTRPETEVQKTTAYVDVKEVTLSKDIKPIFGGWMFASSPGLNAIEHPVYDVWLEDCKADSDVPPPSN